MSEEKKARIRELNKIVQKWGNADFSESAETVGYVRSDFERWVVTERRQNVDRYQSYPNSYRNTDVATMWASWKASHSYYKHKRI